MEGKADRGEGEDSPEGQADGLDDYRGEIRERYPDSDSGNDDQGKVEPVSGEASKHVDSASDTTLEEDTSDSERNPERPDPSSGAEKSEPKAEARDTLDDERRTAEHPEPKVEAESQGDLEHFRDDVKEKYPQGEVSKSDVHDESGRISQSNDEDAEGSRSQAGRGDSVEKTETTGKAGDASAAESVPQDSAQNVMAQENGQPPSDFESDSGRTAALQPGESSIEVEVHDGNAKESKASGGGAEDADSLKDNRVAKDPGTSEGHDGGGKNDSPLIDSVGKSQATRESQTRLAKEAGTGRDQSPKSGKELTDLERIGSSNKEKGDPARKESDVRTAPGGSLSESSRQEKLDRADAIPVNANLRQSNPVVIRFDIPKQAIEEKTGVKMDEDKLYHIKGTVVGKYDFEMYRTPDSYIRHFVPVEHQHQIQASKVHDIRITSVKEVPLTKAQSELVSEWRDRGVPWNRIAYRINHMQPERAEGQIQPPQDSGSEKTKLHQLEKLERVDNIRATFVAQSRLHKGDLASPRDRFYLQVDNSEYKRKTGMSIEEGATYKIKGEIEGVGTFEKKLRSVAAGQDMQIYVPHELKSKVELGKEYKITIDSVERIPSVRDSWEKLERPATEWTWKEIASWIDTEGRINSKSGFYADIAQKDKKVIEEICGFYEDHGLHPDMILQKSVGCYHARLGRVDDVATVIKNIEPYIRTENKKEQIQQFKEKLSAPRKTLHGGIREARKILDLE